MQITLAQINLIIGDIDGNITKILSIYEDSIADMVIFPELAIVGYPPEDLVLSDFFIQQYEKSLNRLIAATSSKLMIIGGIHKEDGRLFNCCYIMQNGEVLYIFKKSHLPNYGIFDEARIFCPSVESYGMFEFGGKKIALLICEDLWQRNEPIEADLVVIINASPYEKGKINKRVKLVGKLQIDAIYLNQIGGQDDIVFDGNSFFMGKNGQIKLAMEHCKEQIVHFSTEMNSTDEMRSGGNIYAEIYPILILGLRDYLRKNGFSKVILGLSGGIDSALVAAIAVDAIGAENVACYMLPSEYTSKESLDDAAVLASNLQIKYEIINITTLFEECKNSLLPIFGNRKEDITEENMQSRIRGLLLMSISNKMGAMLITTGNKSEMATGFATLYGDMCGGYNPLKDVYKTEVFQLAKWRNLPFNIIEKPPSAELRPNQKDADRLPDYEILDGVLQYLIEGSLDIESANQKYGKEIVERIYRLLYLSEYKRKQSPPGPKISAIAFGKDRRYPISHQFLNMSNNEKSA